MAFPSFFPGNSICRLLVILIRKNYQALGIGRVQVTRSKTKLFNGVGPKFSNQKHILGIEEQSPYSVSQFTRRRGKKRRRRSTRRKKQVIVLVETSMYIYGLFSKLKRLQILKFSEIADSHNKFNSKF